VRGLFAFWSHGRLSFPHTFPCRAVGERQSLDLINSSDDLNTSSIPNKFSARSRGGAGRHSFSHLPENFHSLSRPYTRSEATQEPARHHRMSSPGTRVDSVQQHSTRRSRESNLSFGRVPRGLQKEAIKLCRRGSSDSNRALASNPTPRNETTCRSGDCADVAANHSSHIPSQTPAWPQA